MALATTAAFTFGSWLLPNNQIWVVLRLLQIPAAFAVMVAYSETIMESMLSPAPRPREKVLLGINGSFFAILMTASISYIWRLGGQPGWLLHVDIVAFPIWVSIQSAFLHILAKGAIDNGFPRKERIRLAVWTGICLFVLLIIFVRATDIAGFLEWVRPWLEEPP
jgi:hypothetical protein